MLYYINYLKAIACLLIVNFHSDILYPDNLSILAFGGDIGNNLFFAISGYTLYKSIDRSEFKEGLSWYKKRVMRIFPVLLVFYIASTFTKSVNISNIGDVIETYICPTIYWFTCAIIILYAALFVVEKQFNNISKIILLLGLIVMHIIWDNVWVERYVIGFIAMVAGYELKRKIINSGINIKNSVAIIGSIGIGCLYVLLKIVRMRGVEVFGAVHLAIGLCTVLFALFVMFVGELNETRIKKVSDKHKLMYKVVTYISNMTLSVYLVQGFNERIILRIINARCGFPISYLLSAVVVLSISHIITLLDKYLHEKATRTVEKK